MSGFLVLAVTGALFYAQRASFIAGAGARGLPPKWERRLSHARPAVLGALAVSVMAPGNDMVPGAHAAVVAAVAFVAAGRVGLLGTVVAGAVTLAVLAALAALV